MRKFIYCVVYGLTVFVPAYAQQAVVPHHSWTEAGLPYIQNFSPKEYKENPQNWCAVQDSRGIMYFGNTHGVLVYDGVSWRVIKTSNEYIVRSLNVVNDTVYVGALGDVGYLAPDAKGQLYYVSLLTYIPEAQRNFTDVWYTLAVRGGVYFVTPEYIFRWQNGKMKVWSTEPGAEGYHTAFAVHNEFYVRAHGVGLLQMVADSLLMVPGGERFAQNRIYTILPYDESRLLIGTRTEGLLLFDGRSYTSFPISGELASFFQESQLYHATVLPFGLFAFTTLRGGAVVIDREGNFCQLLNKAAGLRDESIYYAYTDREGALWLAMDNGIARVETPAPLSRYPASLGIKSTVTAITRHQRTLYAGTHLGVYYLDTGSTSLEDPENPFPLFKQVEGIATFVWSLLGTGDQLLAATDKGIYHIQGQQAAPLEDIEAYYAKWLYRSMYDTTLVYVGLIEGLAAIRLENGRWTDLGKVESITEEVSGMAEDVAGDLWLGTQYQGLIKLHTGSVSLHANTWSTHVPLTRFGKAQGLPGMPINPAHIGGQLLLATQKGLRRYDEARQWFVPDATLGSQFADTTTWIFQIQEDFQKNVWLIAGTGYESINGKAVLQTDGSYLWYDTPFRRLTDIGDMLVIYPEPDGTVWLGGAEGIARFTAGIPREYDRDFSTAIRRVSAIATDSVFFYGALLREALHPVIPYDNNSLRFDFAGLSYDEVLTNQYQVMLEGFDKTWSHWTTENKKDYTGLPEGDYTFRVRSQNIAGHIGSEDRFFFTILPPWYRSGWAYLLYVAVGGMAVFVLVKLRVHQLEQKSKEKSKELERIIRKRTAQVVDQRNQLQEQSAQLQEMDRLKSHFFANISHEFRTPLTLILGTLDKLMDKTSDQQHRESYQLMQRNASRLLQLINQLLDLSKLEAGKVKLAVKKGDIVRFLRRIVMSFASLAEQRGIQLTFNGTPVEAAEGHMAVLAYYDEDKLEKVFYNLLSNAVKFTPHGGTIDASLTLDSPEQNMEIGQYIKIAVCNSGAGIPSDKLPYIFDRFYQVEGSNTRKFEGTGIGLSLVKELTTLHHGEVHVESIVDQKTTFTVSLPLSRSAFKGDEFLDEAMTIPNDAPLAEAVIPELAAAVAPSESNAPEQPTDDKPDEETLVLVVEDHPELREFIKEQLREDYTIMEAENGAIGWQKAEENIPDLVISDVMMPEMDGYTLCEKLKTNEKTNHIPVILLTAKAATESKLEGLETGADDYLVKPFNPQELKVRVRNLIRLRQQMREKFSSEMLLKPTDITVSSTQKVFLEKVLAVVEAHLDDEQFSVEQLGDEIGMSRAQTHRKIRALTNQSPSEFIRSFRLQRAAELIRQDAGNMAEIAYQVGFSSQAYFSRCFQEAFGHSPSEYKKKTLSGQL